MRISCSTSPSNKSSDVCAKDRAENTIKHEVRTTKWIELRTKTSRCKLRPNVTCELPSPLHDSLVGDGYFEGGTASGPAFDFDPASVGFDDSLDDMQAQT